MATVRLRDLLVLATALAWPGWAGAQGEDPPAAPAPVDAVAGSETVAASEAATDAAPAATTSEATPAAAEAGPAAEATAAPEPVVAGEVAEPESKPRRTLDEMVRDLDQTGTPSKPKREGELPPPSAEPGQERPLPNYDGREEEPADSADVLIWVPRAVFFPVYLVMEYLIRWPLVSLVTLSEEHALMERAMDLLTWDDGNASILPRFMADFGLRPHVGLSFNWSNIVDGLDIYASASGWDDVLATRAGLAARLFREESAVLSVNGAYVRRPDSPYYGKGDPNDPCASGCRYRSAIGEADVSLRAFLDGLNRATATVAFRDVQLSTDSDTPKLSSVQAGALPGFGGYRLIETELWGEIDTRLPDIEFEPGSGVRLDVKGSFAFDPSNPDLRFFRYGGEAAGFWDFGNRHVLAARLYLDFVSNVGQPLSDGDSAREPIPFTEQITLGGGERMRGHLPGRFRGRQAWVATVEYRYPVWAMFDASFFFSMGNAFPSFRDWDIAHNYLSYGIAFRSSSSREAAFELLLGLGTNRLDARDIDPIYSGRVSIGINQGF